MPKSMVFLFGAVLVLFTSIIAMWALYAFDVKWLFFAILMFLFGASAFLLKDVRKTVLAALVFVIPLNADYNFFYQPSPGGADGIVVGLVEIFLVLLLIITLLKDSTRKVKSSLELFSSISLPSLFFFVTCLVSLLVAQNFMWSMFDIFTFIKVFIFFWLIANNITNKNDIRLVINSLFAGMLAQAVIVAMQFYSGNTGLGQLGFGEASGALSFEMTTIAVERPGGTLGHCNHLARYIGLIVPLSIVLSLLEKSKKRQLYYIIVSLAGLVALITTLTRSSWIGLVASVFVIVPFLFTKRLVTFATLAKLSAAALLFVIMVVFFNDVIVGRLTTYDLGSANTRITTAQVALDIIKDHPVIGVGINNYGAQLEKYWNVEDSFTRKAAVHNTYLLIAAEIGLLGFIAYLLLLFFFFRRIATAMKSRNPYFITITIGIYGSFVAYLLTAITDKSYKENYTLLLVFFCLIAIIEGIHKLEKDEPKIIRVMRPIHES